MAGVINVKQSFVICGLLCLAILALPGCGGEGADTVDVKANITIDGKPPSGPASIMVKGKDGGEVYSGFLNADGSAVFWTNGNQEDPDGLPVGNYIIELHMDPMNPGGTPKAEPANIEVTGPGTLDVNMYPSTGGVPGMGMGIPGGL